MNNRTLLSLLFLSASAFPAFAAEPMSTNITVIATGFNSPRGLKFGPDGLIYVAEAGLGGTVSTVGYCEQVPGPVGPYLGGQSGRISKVDLQGNVSTVASGFASTVDSQGDLMGVADVAFSGGALFALVAGGGCSHGNPSLPNGIYQVDQAAGTGTLVSNLSTFVRLHPTKYENPADFEPDGSFYSMITNGGELIAVEPNHGQLISIDSQGNAQQVLDVSASQGHIVPTVLFAYKANLYLGNLGLFPINQTDSRLLVASGSDCFSDGLAGLQNDNGAFNIVRSKAGFTTIVGMNLGPDGLIYVLEFSNGDGYPTPGLGDVVRISATGAIETVATGLSLPTAMTFGPDGNLYVSNEGATGVGQGQIVRIVVN